VRDARPMYPAPDDDGFVEWATVRRGQLRRTAYLLCGDWATADDLVQETLVRIYPKWRRLAAGNPDAYARRTLTSAFIDDRRRPWRRESSSEVVPETAYDDVLPSGTGLLDALRGVPARQRAVLVLRFWEDLSVEQTVEILGCTSGNVKSQTARGLARLRELLPDETYDQEVSR
jgi:RNA polymerase sigma-70 factor (sigma-E family)